jgi:hypothetical protein
VSCSPRNLITPRSSPFEAENPASKCLSSGLLLQIGCLCRTFAFHSPHIQHRGEASNTALSNAQINTMPSSTSSLVPQATRGPNGYFPYPYSSDTLVGDLRTTLLPVAIMALASFVSTVGLTCFITHRMIFWRKYYRTYPGYNQYLLLIFNLILADCQQSIAFLISFHWIAKKGILAPTAACFIQGWLVQVGDVSSGIWVLSIAIHTWFSVVRGRQVEYVRFCYCLVGIWVFIMLLAIIGPIAHPKNYFVNTGAWVCYFSSWPPPFLCH